MPSNVTIDSIKNAILNPALTSHFECDIQLPSTSNGRIQKFFGQEQLIPTSIQQNLVLSCCETSLPGSSINTHELTNDYTGVTQRNAYRRLYDDRIDFTFYVDTSYQQIRFFERWMKFISGEQITDAESLVNNYRIEFPKYYKSPMIKITKFERDYGGKIKTPGLISIQNLIPKSITYSFYNAFPINVNSIPVSYDNGQLLRCTVSFSYDRYSLGYLSENPNIGTFVSEISQQTQSPEQPQPSIPPGVYEKPYLQSSFNISQFSGGNSFI